MSGNPEHTPAADTDPEPADHVDGDEAELLIADPDDYHETQRLREIHEARREVQRVHREADHFARDEEHSKQQADLAAAVSSYIYELLPLIKIADWDDELADGLAWASLEAYATTTGMKPAENGYERAAYQESMTVFAEANAFLAEVKPLIQEEDTDTWEV